MASETAALSNSKVTWNQKLTDFALILKSGEEFRCHKFVLANNSPVFESMFGQEADEGSQTHITIDHFDEETVVVFLEYLYAETLKKGAKSIDKKKMTLKVLSMAHMYQVKDLMAACTDYLKDSICDENVMEIWMEAIWCKNKSLCSTAMEHLVERPRGKTLQEVPGFADAFESHEKPLKDLLATLSDKSFRYKEEISELREKLREQAAVFDKNSELEKEVADLKEKLRQEEGRNIKITVRRPSNAAEENWSDEFYVKTTDKISSLLQKVQAKNNLGEGAGYALTMGSSMDDRKVLRNSTFSQNGICTCTNTTLHMWKVLHGW